MCSDGKVTSVFHEKTPQNYQKADFFGKKLKNTLDFGSVFFLPGILKKDQV
jgi:hypothetical protein